MQYHRPEAVLDPIEVEAAETAREAAADARAEAHEVAAEAQAVKEEVSTVLSEDYGASYGAHAEYEVVDELSDVRSTTDVAANGTYIESYDEDTEPSAPPAYYEYIEPQALHAGADKEVAADVNDGTETGFFNIHSSTVGISFGSLALLIVLAIVAACF